MPLIGALRQVAAGIKHRLDRAFYPRRRSAALRRIRQLAPESVLVVCLGNICRSPYAGRLLEERSEGRLRVSSAGFIGPGRPPPEEALAAAQARGVTHGDHRSARLDPSAATTADVILVFDRDNVRRLRALARVEADRVIWLGDLDPVWSGRRAISDPWGQGLEAFHATFDRIERCVTAFLAAVPDPTDSAAKECLDPLP